MRIVSEVSGENPHQGVNIQAYGVSILGTIRRENQDAYCIEERVGLYAVADGLGGLSRGKEASAFAIQALKNQLAHLPNTEESRTAQGFGYLVRAINRALYETSRREWAVPDPGVGTTLSALWIQGNQAFIAHVGDSFILHIRGEQICYQTTPHTLAQRIRGRLGGPLVSEDVIPYHYHDILTHCLGQRAVTQIDTACLDLEPGDQLLLATDGLSKLFKDVQLLSFLKQFPHQPEAFTRSILAEAAKGDIPDNLTLITLSVEP